LEGVNQSTSRIFCVREAAPRVSTPRGVETPPDESGAATPPAAAAGGARPRELLGADLTPALVNWKLDMFFS
jgi:hypothetical protein